MADEAPTKEQLEGSLGELNAELKSMQKALRDKLAAFKDAVSAGTAVEELADMGSAISKAKDAIGTEAADGQKPTGQYAKIAAMEHRIANFEFEARADERNALSQAEHDEAVSYFTERRAQWTTVGVNQVTLTVTIPEDESEPVLCNIKLAGPGVAATRTPRTASSNGGNGFKSHGAIRIRSTGQTFRSRNAAYMELRGAKDGKEPAPANTAAATRWLEGNDYHFDEVAAE